MIHLTGKIAKPLFGRNPSFDFLKLAGIAVLAIPLFACADTVSEEEPTTEDVGTSQEALIYLGRFKLKNQGSGKCVGSSGGANMSACASAYAFEIYKSATSYNVCKQDTLTNCLSPVYVPAINLGGVYNPGFYAVVPNTGISSYQWKESGGVITSTSLGTAWTHDPLNGLVVSPNVNSPTQKWTFVK